MLRLLDPVSNMHTLCWQNPSVISNMAAVVFMRYQNRRAIRRNKIFRDRTNPLDVYNDDEIYKKFRFHRQAILDLTARQCPLRWPSRQPP